MLNKLVLRIFLSLSLAFAGAANATIITQEIFYDAGYDSVDEFELIGSITINTHGADQYEVWDDVLGEFVKQAEVNEWVEFNLFGFDMITEGFADLLGDPSYFGFFSAIVNPNDWYAGIESLDFDLSEDTYGFYEFNGYIDTAFDDGYGSFDVFSASGDLYEFGTLKFGEVSVPEPSTLIMLFAGLLALVTRRKSA
ncbi:PEP-CTERM sorting domain-containing protein [Thalassotalea sp. PLHSN55]|uniref:PEP-CTERM sorting domain-containing protein n=1 Tax=Thalassotalea sp. PLHSN55 TaxID=3435888 RepID=UPI003F846049